VSPNSLDDRHFHSLFVGDLLDDGRHCGFARTLGGKPATFTGNELKSPVELWPDQNWLDDAGSLNRIGQLG
jgi:hypothetical protein